MKIIFTLLVSLILSNAIAQTKSTGLIKFSGVVTANFTFSKPDSMMTLVLEGPADKWFGIGIGTQSMNAGGDALYYTDTVIDACFDGETELIIDSKQDWKTITNEVTGNIRTITLERALDTGDPKDFKIDYDSLDKLDLGAAFAKTPSLKLSYPHNRKHLSAVVSAVTPSAKDFSIAGTIVTNTVAFNQFSISSPVQITRIDLYSHAGSFVKTYDFKDGSKDFDLQLENISKGTYFLELKNSTEKTWKKIVIK